MAGVQELGKEDIPVVDAFEGWLSNVTQEDCDLIDDLMTRYSVYEHSQADDLPAVPPELAQLEADMKSLADWMEGYSKRVA
ncbi:hypothetical protein [Pseudomonas rhodesiae]|uniref:hypothetical protein n=1 Tax=Pseudomonas rhodesiae TaxID=76760 RepID=UPI0032B1DFCF